MALVEILALSLNAVGIVGIWLTLRANARSAREAIRGNQIALAVQRPWVSLDGFALHQEASGERIVAAIWRNVGQSAAMNLQLRIAWRTGSKGDFQPFDLEDGAVVGVLGPGQTAMVHTRAIDTQTLLADRCFIRIRADYQEINSTAESHYTTGDYRLLIVPDDGMLALRWSVISGTSAS